MTFTIHFIDNNWDQRSLCLDTAPLYADCTGQSIADAYYKGGNEHSIHPKQVSEYVQKHPQQTHIN